MTGFLNSIGATVAVQSIKSCVVYDSESGQIHHHHSVLTLVGGKEPTDDQIGHDALRALGRRPKAITGKPYVLHVAYNALEPGKRYRVDHTKRTLILHEREDRQ